MAGGTVPSGGVSSSGGMMPLTMTPPPVQPTTPMPTEPSPSPASPVVQTLDKDDDEDIAEDQPMPAQPLLPARRPRALSIADPPTGEEARAEVVHFATPAEAPVRVVPAAPAIDASSEGAVAPASKKPDNITLSRSSPSNHCLMCSLRLQPSSSSSEALPEPTARSSPTEPEAKKQSSSKRRTMKTWLWIHSIHCSQPILQYFLLMNNQQLLLRILKLAGHAVDT